MSLALLGMGAALAAGMVQGPPELLAGVQLGAARTAYDPAALVRTRVHEARCTDLHRDPDGAWPVPLTSMADTPAGGAVLVATADRTDCYYLMRPGTGTLEAIPLDIAVPRAYALRGDPDGRLGRDLARAVGVASGRPPAEGEARRSPERFRAEGDVQSLVVAPAAGAPPACAPIDAPPAATLTLLGSGVPTREPPLGLPGDHPRADLDRPGALFAVSVQIDAQGRPVPGCAPRAWPLWTHLVGAVEDGALSLPGARPRYDDREAATMDRLGFTAAATDAPLVPRPTSRLDARALGDPESLAPVLPVGVTDLQWLSFAESARQARPTQAGAGAATTHDVLLVAPGRTDHLPWLLADRAGWPLVSALEAPAVGIGSDTTHAARWGAVLQHTASHVDQLRPVVQADAVLPPAGARSSVQVAAVGAMDPQVFVDAFEQTWPRRQLIKGVPWDAGRSGVAARIERSVGSVFGRSGADLDGVFLPPGAMPRLPVLPIEASDSWVQQWRFSVNGAALGGGALWVGLGDPVEDAGWRAVVLRMDPAVLDPGLGPDEARAAAAPSTVRFVQHWRLYEPLLVRWMEKTSCEEDAPGVHSEAGRLDGMSDEAGDDAPCEAARRVHARTIAFWGNDFLRFLYRTSAPVEAGRTARAERHAVACAPPTAPDIRPIACTVGRLGELEWASEDIRHGAIETHAPKYPRRVRTWLRYQRARQHSLLTHRADRVHKDQARLGFTEPPSWTRRSVDVRLEPQVGALLRAGADGAAEDLAEAGARQAHTFALPPSPDAAVAALPWPESLHLREVEHDAARHIEVEAPLGMSQLVAVDHRVRWRRAEGGRVAYVTAWVVLTDAVLAALPRSERTLRRRAGDLLVRTFLVDIDADGAPTGLREHPRSTRLVVETSDGMDAFIDFDAERFRKRAKLLTARAWESRWLYRSDDPQVVGKSSLTAESKQSLDVQRMLMDQLRWPASTRGLDGASSAELIDQDNVLVVALGGRPYDLTTLGVPVPISFVEVPLPIDIAFREVPPPPPIVMQSRLPWLYTPSMVPSEAGWLTRPKMGTLRCEDTPAGYTGPTGVGTEHFGGEPCFFRIGDMQYDPDSRSLLLSAAEPPGVGEWRTYLATLDQSWFSPLATLPAAPDAPAGTRPALARRFAADGTPLLGLQYRATPDAPTHADFHWLKADELSGSGERQRVAPCLDPSDSRCNLR